MEHFGGHQRRPAGNGRVLSRHGDGLDRFMGLVLVAAAVCLAVGVTMPVVRVREFLIFSNEFSIAQAARDLWRDGQVFLAFLVATFSIVFPGLKTLGAISLWYGLDYTSRHFGHTLALVDFLGKWSFTDVLVVAILIVVAKSTGLAEAQAMPGLYFFSASVVLTAFAVHRLRRVAGRIEAGGPGGGADGDR
ncbi:MAG: paraquat-inducible protein A [Hyphomicrobiales bacterium]|nr:paraquat-inducible protein A [Hyphomicrobiales bacterium]MCP5374389.1 paraquat-inducible protein A [Hyphomicrobiales bacterium]